MFWKLIENFYRSHGFTDVDKSLHEIMYTFLEITKKSLRNQINPSEITNKTQRDHKEITKKSLRNQINRSQIKGR